jgi:uncharacterized ferritin-like protein (DUF455 family)
MDSSDECSQPGRQPGRERGCEPGPGTLRHQALAIVLERAADRKAGAAFAADRSLPSGAGLAFDEPPGIPGRPTRPLLVAPTHVPRRSLADAEGRAALIHALAHIELNAIDLAADACWRFGELPDDFHRDWTRVMAEEAHHFRLLVAHLATLGYAYGDFEAHDALWQMAERTKHDVLARMALVPRTLEARGLDASPAVRHKLASAGDRRAAEIVDVILADEIGHVEIGNRWYAYLCARDGLEPLDTYASLARTHDAPTPRGPFNLPARRAAGFTDAELRVLAS